jgi:uncharacterized protein involved in exopolysaccharide biosynthesis
MSVNVNEAAMTLQTKIMTAMLKTIPKVSSNSKRKQKNWITKDIIALYKEKEVIYKKLKANQQNRNLKSKFVQLVKKLKKEIAKAKRTFFL